MRWVPRAIDIQAAQVEWTSEWACPRCNGTTPAPQEASATTHNCDTCGYAQWLITERTAGFASQGMAVLNAKAQRKSWYSHDFAHFPPTNITGRHYSWLFMPLIYAAADMPRHPSWQFDVSELSPHWGEWVTEYRVAFQEAGITAAWDS